MVIYLIVVAIVAFSILFVMFKNYRTVVTSHLEERHPHVRITMSWILLLLMLGSLGGAVFAAVHPSDKAKTATVKQSSSHKHASQSSSKKIDKLAIQLSTDTPTVGNELTLSISSKTSVKIIGHNTRSVYQTFDAGKNSKKETFKYTFTSGGPYDIVIQRGSKTITKAITVSGTSAAFSSTAISSAASSSTSTAPSTANNSQTAPSTGPSNNADNNNATQNSSNTSSTESVAPAAETVTPTDESTTANN